MPDRSDSRELEPGVDDVFGVPTVNTLINVLDVASHYPYSPERWRIQVNGSRKFPEYNSVSQYNHTGPHHELIPNQGDTVKFETAERPRYAVGFEQIFTMACGVSRTLESGDQVRIGVFDDSDGWFIEHNPSHATDEVDLVVRAGGSDSTEVSSAKLQENFSNFNRYELRTAWYRVTRQLWRQTSVSGAESRTDFIGRTHKSDGPEVGNLPVRFEITRGSSSSAITLEAGSCSTITQGGKSEIRRVKTHEVDLTTDTNADGSNWFPRYAMRVDPGRSIVNTQISTVLIPQYAGNNDVRVLLSSHDPSKVQESGPSTLDDADFSTPSEHMSQNSVLEETDTSTVTQAADSSGSTQTSTSDPGGYQVGYASLHASGTGSSAGKAADATTKKRGINGGDTIVMWVRADDSGVNLQVNITTEQDW